MRTLYFTLLFALLAGCQSFSRNEHGWLTPKKQTPQQILQPQILQPQTLLGQVPPPIPSAIPLPTTQPDNPFLAHPAPVSVSPVTVPQQPIAETPQQAAAAHLATDLPVVPSAAPITAPPAAPLTAPLHDPFAAVQSAAQSAASASVQSIPTETTGSPWANPWGGGDISGLNQAVSIEEAAKKEEAEQERARLEALAAAKPQDGTPDYLKPLEKWNGPFETRQQQNTTEQDIIRQVGYVDVKKTIDNEPVYDWEKEQEKGFDWEVLDPVHFFTKIRDWMGMGPDEKKANAAMKKGYDILDPLRNKKPDPADAKRDQKQWLAAAAQFEEAAKRWPNSVIEEDALHLTGECYFFGDNYPKAMTAYQKLVINYQHSKHVDNAVRRLFSIARFWEKEDQRGANFTNFSHTDRTRPTFDSFGNAKKAYETIYINDPNGPISDDAVMALASAFLAKGHYKGDPNFDEAARYYTYLRENYPLSKHIVQAHELEIYARTNAYQGAEHNSKTLEEANKLAERTLTQFGGELESESKQEILAQKEAIILCKAEKEWVTGQFYDKKSYFGAARLQYEKILDQYPQTPFAEKARERLAQIKNKPSQPDQLEFFKKIYMPRGTI